MYLTFTSLLAKAAVPPFDWKNFVADSLPPTFIVRSCAHCHTTASHQWLGASCDEQTYHQDSSIEQRRCAPLGCGGWRSSRGIDTRQMAPMTMSGSSVHNQNISAAVSVMAQRVSDDVRTLLAGFVFSFSKTFCDCNFVAVGTLMIVNKADVSREQRWGVSKECYQGELFLWARGHISPIGNEAEGRLSSKCQAETGVRHQLHHFHTCDRFTINVRAGEKHKATAQVSRCMYAPKLLPIAERCNRCLPQRTFAQSALHIAPWLSDGAKIC